VDYRRGLAAAYYQLGGVAHQLGDEIASQSFFRDCLEIRRALAAADPTNARGQKELITVLPHCGEHAEAAERAEALQRANPKDQEILIAVACSYSICAAVPEDEDLHRRYTAKAIEALEEAVALGFKDVSSLETDLDLEPIRREPGFIKLVEDLKLGPTDGKAPR
jgi:tetratricopeptide (TPR) repeat protein